MDQAPQWDEPATLWLDKRDAQCVEEPQIWSMGTLREVVGRAMAEPLHRRPCLVIKCASAGSDLNWDAIEQLALTPGYPFAP